MKKLLFLLSLCTAVISVSAQGNPKPKDYSDYQPCTQCFEDWKTSESHSTEIPSDGYRSLGRTGNSSRKPFNQTYVGQELNSSIRIIVGSILTIATAAILIHATKPTIQ